MKVISLGWGIQSFTLAAMSALGELEPVDVAIHADTTHEASGTYTFARAWMPWLEEHGVQVVTVSSGVSDKWLESSRLKGYGTPPLFTQWKTDGKMRRSCTQRWEIAPMRRWLQANRNGKPVEQWLGISLDEVQRMRDSDVKYITNRYPLIERRMTRWDCEQWLVRHNLKVPPKSACVFCPFHDTGMWRSLKQSGNGDWQKALEVDEAIRKARPPYDLYLHPSRQPLELVDFSTETDHGQLSLWDEECSGICGV